MSLLLEAGRLISTSDMKLAKRLGQVVRVEDITCGATPERLRQSARGLSFMFHGDYYELEPAA